MCNGSSDDDSGVNTASIGLGQQPSWAAGNRLMPRTVSAGEQDEQDVDDGTSSLMGMAQAMTPTANYAASIPHAPGSTVIDNTSTDSQLPAKAKTVKISENSKDDAAYAKQVEDSLPLPSDDEKNQPPSIGAATSTPPATQSPSPSNTFGTTVTTTPETPEVSADADSSNLEQKLPSAMKGLGPVFQKYGKQYDIDPNLLAAVSMHESAKGTSRAFRQGNNAMGVSNSSGPVNFDSLEDSIATQARKLGTSSMYKTFRQTGRLGDLASVYAPIGAENDPYSLNKDWVGGVAKYYKQLQGG